MKLHLTISCFVLYCVCHIPCELWNAILKRRDFWNTAINGRMIMKCIVASQPFSYKLTFTNPSSTVIPVVAQALRQSQLVGRPLTAVFWDIHSTTSPIPRVPSVLLPAAHTRQITHQWVHFQTTINHVSLPDHSTTNLPHRTNLQQHACLSRSAGFSLTDSHTLPTTQRTHSPASHLAPRCSTQSNSPPATCSVSSLCCFRDAWDTSLPVSRSR